MDHRRLSWILGRWPDGPHHAAPSMTAQPTSDAATRMHPVKPRSASSRLTRQLSVRWECGTRQVA